jgi:hypothetical protein
VLQLHDDAQGESMSRFATVTLIFLLIISMIWTQTVDEIWGLASSDVWLLMGLGLCIVRFVCLNYVFNAILLNKPQFAALRPKGKWFLTDSRRVLPELDQCGRVAIISWPGFVVYLIAIFGFFPLMYISLNPEWNPLQIPGYAPFLLGVCFALLPFAFTLIKGETLRSE